MQVDPWKIIENEYHASSNQVSESLFSIANEYSGVRGFLDEGGVTPTLVGTYFNGLYVYSPEQHEGGYRGITKKVHYMINSVNWLKTTLTANGETLNLGNITFSDFRRELDMRTGEMKRTFLWHLAKGELLQITFSRLLSMVQPHYAYQKITLQSLKGTIVCKLLTALDFSIVHWGKFNFWSILSTSHDSINRTIIGGLPTEQRLFSGYRLDRSKEVKSTPFLNGKIIGDELEIPLSENESFELTKRVTNCVEKDDTQSLNTLQDRGLSELVAQPSYSEAIAENRCFYERFWKESDIEITGDETNQQGIRYCLFQLVQTYHGFDPSNNIGAKGLTGEAYSGHTFWDTETYCLPFYLFNDPASAKNLLMYRYKTLPMAKERAKELDCLGACYPIATLNGYESCNLWQHASTQFQPSTAVAYGIMHYVNVTADTDFLDRYGVEMMIEISRFLLSRGDFNADRTKFGFFGVMGPDEFQMMVNHNTYTNFMAKMTFENTLKVLNDLKKRNPGLYQTVILKTNLSSNETALFQEAMEKTVLLYDENTKLFEQHQGYFELPHVEIDKIPETDFPLYSHWSYDRIYRNDMIKQPDVLMFLFLYNRRFSFAQKRANYEFYEPRCIHESSLSPSIHSVLATELGKAKEALDFFQFATRMDLDDYNRNASEGLHMTSISAAWVNIVYGFGGLRSDGPILSLSPRIPTIWNSYSFKIHYRGIRIDVKVTQKYAEFTVNEEFSEAVEIYGKTTRLTVGTTRFSLE